MSEIFRKETRLKRSRRASLCQIYCWCVQQMTPSFFSQLKHLKKVKSVLEFSDVMKLYWHAKAPFLIVLAISMIFLIELLAVISADVKPI